MKNKCPQPERECPWNIRLITLLVAIAMSITGASLAGYITTKIDVSDNRTRIIANEHDQEGAETTFNTMRQDISDIKVILSRLTYAIERQNEVNK